MSSHGGADAPYLGGSAPVVDPAQITVRTSGSGMSSSSSSGGTPTATATATPAPTTAAMASSETTTQAATSNQAPGFTVVIGLAALAGATLFALRRTRE
ncbi:MAG: PGF-CTERM sorting domain-containing protein [Salinigranum sp.]